MSNIRSLFGTSFTRYDGSIGNYLYGQIGNSVYNISSNTIQPINIGSKWTLPSTDIGTEDSDFAVFEDTLFHVNGRGPNLALNMQNSSATWSDTNFSPTPLAKHIEPYQNRLYLANLRMKFVDDQYNSPNTNAQYVINNPIFPRRVWFSDLPDNGKLTWGFGYGNIGVWSLDSAANLYRIPTQPSLFTKAGYWFVSNNIKIGDPVYINKGSIWYQFEVAEIESEYTLKLVSKKSTIGSVTSLNFWVGGNWFDVPMDASDYITQIEANKFLDTLLIFGRNSLFQYNTSSLKPVSEIGTTSSKSVKTIKGLTFYFHGSDREKTGFYYWNGTREVKVSGRVQPFIDAISTSNYTSVVAWQDGNKYRAYIGNLSKTFSSISAYDISMNNAVFTYDLENDAQSIDPIGHAITSSTSFTNSNGLFTTYLGNSANEVMQVDEAYSFNGLPITMKASTGPIFPKGTQVVNEFTRIQVVSKDANGVSVEYRLWLDPYNVSPKWYPLGRLNQSRVELPIKREFSQAVGIDIRFVESSTDQTTPSIEHLTIYSRPVKTKLVEIQSL